MNLHDAEKLAIELIRKHITAGPIWTFRYNDCKASGGRCLYGSKIIELSRDYTRLREEFWVRDTILHEIAHALTPNAHHGPAWVKKALEIGCNGKRCFTDMALPGPYVGTCPAGHKHYRFKKQGSKLKSSCQICQPKRFDERYLITYKKNENYGKDT